MQSAREQQQSVCRRRPPIVKSRRGEWVEEDMTMHYIDTIKALTLIWGITHNIHIQQFSQNIHPM